jgi:hypothetical protein
MPVSASYFTFKIEQKIISLPAEILVRSCAAAELLRHAVCRATIDNSCAVHRQFSAGSRDLPAKLLESAH